MNPFDLPGPAFLVLYLALCVVAIGAAYDVVRRAESGPPPALPLKDPYQIAWLRGGVPEAARVAVLSLVDRGLIELSGGRLYPGGAPPPAPRSRRLDDFPMIERAILDRCDGANAGLGPSATEIWNDGGVIRACEEYREPAERLGLLPGAAVRARRQRWYLGAGALLAAVGLIKLGVAIERGKTNVAFLIFLIAAAVVVVLVLLTRRRTALGDSVLADLRGLFAAAKARAAYLRPGEMTSDAVLLAAVFGLSALPAQGFAELQQTYKKASSGGSGCGSSCGSGCGGGGGCGGCGSG